MPIDKEAWRKENTTIIKCRIMNSSDDYVALNEAIIGMGTNMSQYLKRAIHEQLIRDGYLNAESAE